MKDHWSSMRQEKKILLWMMLECNPILFNKL